MGIEIADDSAGGEGDQEIEVHQWRVQAEEGRTARKRLNVGREPWSIPPCYAGRFRVSSVGENGCTADEQKD